MKVSTRGEYGVRAMVALAKHAGDRPVSIGVISKESAVPYAYLEQLIVPLRRAGLVDSKRGAHGDIIGHHPGPDVFFIGIGRGKLLHQVCDGDLQGFDFLIDFGAGVSRSISAPAP